jgi:hypothetical protein
LRQTGDCSLRSQGDFNPQIAKKTQTSRTLETFLPMVEKKSRVGTLRFARYFAAKIYRHKADDSPYHPVEPVDPVKKLHRTDPRSSQVNREVAHGATATTFHL